MASVLHKSARPDGCRTPSIIISGSRSVSDTDYESSSLGDIISENSDATSLYLNPKFSQEKERTKF